MGRQMCDIWMVSSGLAPPTRVREGVVTDSSIELLWDPAQGDARGYEVMCLDCVHSHVVNLTNQQHFFYIISQFLSFLCILVMLRRSFNDVFIEHLI